MARLTGLEPATPGVTGRYSNQLSYNRAVLALPGRKEWWVVRGSNSRHLRCKRSALPTELTTRDRGFSQRLGAWQVSIETILHPVFDVKDDALPARHVRQIAQFPARRDHAQHPRGDRMGDDHARSAQIL